MTCSRPSIGRKSARGLGRCFPAAVAVSSSSRSTTFGIEVLQQVRLVKNTPQPRSDASQLAGGAAVRLVLDYAETESTSVSPRGTVAA